MTQPDLDDDFSDLDEIISRDETKRAEARAASARHKKLARGNLSEDERVALLAEIRRYEDLHVWTTVAAVALFHSQECLSCGHKHRFFLGWMTQQDHKRDPHCRRLLRGRPAETVPSKIEEQAQDPVEMCGDCCEAALIIEEIAGRVNADIEIRQIQAAIDAQRKRQEDRVNGAID